MEYIDIETLIHDVNKIARHSDPEVLRSSCIRHVQTVYRLIGLDIFKQRKVYVTKPDANTVVIPPSVMKVEDVRWCGMGLRERMFDDDCTDRWPYRYGFYNFDQLSYKVMGNKIRLSRPVDEVAVVFISLPVDGKGEIVIDSRMYDATLNYCIGQELMAKASNVKQDYATMNPAAFYVRQARELMDSTRATYSEASVGELRDFILNTDGR